MLLSASQLKRAALLRQQTGKKKWKTPKFKDQPENLKRKKENPPQTEAQFFLKLGAR